jgi:hypothetical protein
VSQRSLRVRYLLQRARRLSLGNVTEFARQVQRVSKVPLPVIVGDMMWCSVRYEMGFRDYAVWDIRLLSARERRTWMTHPKAIRLNNTLNGPDSEALLGDKPRFYRDFADLIGREWIDAAEATDEEIAAFLARHPRVLVKPALGEGGRGITTFSADEIPDVASWRAQLIADGRSLIEQVLPQHERMSELYAGSVNTIRIITYRAPDGVFHVIASVLRIGNGGVVDNFAGGGMFTMLDDEGVARWGAVDKHSNVFSTHPVTGVPIAGFAVPQFAEALAMVEEASRRLPTVPYVGWDVAITPDGPALIEANHNSSVFQMKPSVSGVRTGLLHRYRDAVGPGILERR